jgi:ATP-dependent helicase/nuclease subunit A
MSDAHHPVPAPAYQWNGEPVPRERFYAIACDPRRSVAVEACAGAGKTWILVSRVVRALLAGAQPHEILAITFTKKAAGEMRQRLHEWLSLWAGCPDDRLDEALAARGVEPGSEAREALRTQYRRLLHSGRPVQIRTFHSWFAGLLRHAPLSVLQGLRLPARYELLENDAEAVARVWRRFYVAVAADAAARADYEGSVAAHGRSQTQKALHAALSRRVEFALADAQGVVEDSVRGFAERYPQFAAFESPEQSLATEAARQRWRAWAAALWEEKNKTPRKAAQCIVDAMDAPDLVQRLAQLRKALFVAAEDRLTAHLAKFPAAIEAEAELQALCPARAQHEAWLHHGRITRLARILVAEFAALKRERGWIDMNDVEQAARLMLADPVLSGWVQERLDARVKHLLIDEFQDTNPLQWQALHAWLSAYAGAGAAAPGVFVVGDPKQSIYRFRRAEPQVFRAAQRFVVDGLDGGLLSCDHTHRNARGVLEVVNAVMTQAQQAGDYEGFRAHTTQSTQEGGAWALPQIPRGPAASPAAGAAEPEWRDSLTMARELAEEKLVTLECRQAAAFIAQRLRSGVRPSEIMVLARRRDRLAAMQQELRALHIPAQQPEKTELCEQPEVQDLVALLDVLVSPSHDLALARALKSPVFGLPDEALVELALRARAAREAQQPRSWFELLRADDLPANLREAGERLARWQAVVDRLPPHDALQRIYEDAQVLARYAQATPAPLRATVLAHLRALLGAALEVAGGRYLTPYAFVRALRAGGIEGPAVAGTDAVRLLTVHGAKGLEAPIVLILDADAPAPRAEAMGVLCDWPGEAAEPRRFAFIASESRPPPCSADALMVEQAARRREELNALYVAMTRAGRELVVSSVQPAHGNAASWWQRLLPLCLPLAAPEPGEPFEQAAVGAQIELRVVPDLPPAPGAAAAEASTLQSRIGQALHRLLEHWRYGQPPAASRLQRTAREFALDEAAMAKAAEMARRIVAGEAAWAWSPEAVDWQGNEVELVHAGERMRIDRLVRHAGTGEWWVLDYKSALDPAGRPELLAQIARYRQAVANAYPGASVRAAFITGDGRLVAAEP